MLRFASPDARLVLLRKSVTDLRCGACRLVMIDPVHLSCCATMMCRACSERLLVAADVQAACPSCHAPLLVTSISTTHFVAVKIAELIAHCVHADHGCGWQAPTGVAGSSVRAHLRECEYKCKFCRVGCEKEEMGRHLSDECAQRKHRRRDRRDETHQNVVHDNHQRTTAQHSRRCL